MAGACVEGEGRGVRSRRNVHCSGRYASYWNAFLLINAGWSASSETTELTNRKI